MPVGRGRNREAVRHGNFFALKNFAFALGEVFKHFPEVGVFAAHNADISLADFVKPQDQRFFPASLFVHKFLFQQAPLFACLWVNFAALKRIFWGNSSLMSKNFPFCQLNYTAKLKKSH